MCTDTTRASARYNTCAPARFTPSQVATVFLAAPLGPVAPQPGGLRPKALPWCCSCHNWADARHALLLSTT